MQLQIQSIFHQIDRVVIGQEDIKKQILIAVLSGGHVLLEGAPGLGKTLLAKTIAQTLDLDFSRIQFTPDLLPSDLVGSRIYDEKTKNFHIQTGPIFAGIVLADEINRAPSKVQSALLEAMQEKQVTIAGETFLLPDPFFVLATQNPLEQEGTYPLPEAQLDRFFFKILLEYPSRQEEKNILKQDIFSEKIEALFSAQDILDLQKQVEKIEVSDAIYEYVLSLVALSRNSQIEDIMCGVSPRASIALISAAKSKAFIEGRTFVIPEDIQYVMYPIFRHRIILSYDALASGKTPDEIIGKILSLVPLV